MRHLLSALAAVGALAATGAAQTAADPKPSTPSKVVDPHTAPRDNKHYNLGKDNLAIAGYDPVAYFPEGGGKPLEGKKEFTHTHRGVTYRFATQANLDAFKANPDKYEPAYGGWCASAIADNGKKVEIDPKAFKVTANRLFLFYTDLFTDARSYWNKDEVKNTAAADTNWTKISGESPRKPDAAESKPKTASDSLPASPAPKK